MVRRPAGTAACLHPSGRLSEIGKDPSLISTSYEDIRIGDIAKTGFVTVTEEYVRGFADLTGDRHPLHLDPEYAARTRFGQRIAHGALMMSTLLGLVELHPSYLQCFYDRAVAPHGKGRQLAESIDAPLL